MNQPFTRGFCAISIALLVQFTPLSLAAPYDQMVVFGDSLSDNGNFSAALGPGALSALNYDSQRLTNGPGTTPASSLSGVTVEYLNRMLGLPALRPSVFGGNNYAWARATTDLNRIDLAHGITPGTGTQVAAYLSTHQLASPDSLYVLWGGANDLFNSNTTSGIRQAETAAIGNLTSQITALLNAGAKNILWFNLPDLSLTPLGQLVGPVLSEQLHLSSLQFQQDWASSLQSFRSNHPDANITGVDTYAFLLNLLTQPATYGLSNVTTPAQGMVGIDPDQYLFWDTLHPTTRADAVLAGFAYQQLPIAAVPEASTGMYIALLSIGLVLRRIWSARVSGRSKSD